MKPASCAQIWIIAVNAIAAALILLANRCAAHEQRLRKLEATPAPTLPSGGVLFRLGPSAAPVGEEGESAPMA